MPDRPKKLEKKDSPFTPKRPPTRLSEDQVRDIYTRIWAEQESMAKLAVEYELHPETVRKIKHKKLWRAFTDRLDAEYGW